MNEPQHAIIDTTLQASPQEVMTMVSAVAKATKALVGNSVISLQGKKYIRVEGWQAIAAAHGCTVTTDSVIEQADGAIISTATVKRLRDGTILGQSESYVGMDEVWGKRPMYARRAMAQTRAISRACRNAFAHVVVAMNTEHAMDLQTTPAEEVPEGGFTNIKQDTQGNVKTKIPTWLKDQLAEASGYQTDILNMLTANYANDPDKDRGYKELQAFKQKHKYDDPSSVIDLLAKWKTDLQETFVVEE